MHAASVVLLQADSCNCIYCSFLNEPWASRILYIPFICFHTELSGSALYNSADSFLIPKHIIPRAKTPLCSKQSPKPIQLEMPLSFVHSPSWPGNFLFTPIIYTFLMILRQGFKFRIKMWISCNILLNNVQLISVI